METLLEPTVAAALEKGGPVVALESTLVTHGLPWPDNLETARAAEAAVRESGAVPATIALLKGRIRIGLAAEELEGLAKLEAPLKLSARDLAPAAAKGLSGGTTVAATLALAAVQGIRVFATGGIGGVHRGGESSLDVSADLEALARHPLALISAGAKAILDLPRTLERLETLGVPVLGIGSRAFPAFYSAESGLEVSALLPDLEAAARTCRGHWELGGGGLLVANPPPAGAALSRLEVEDWILMALQEADDQGIAGPEVTPFLLSRLGQLSGGRTLACNRALIASNARLGGELAVALTGLSGG